MGMHAAAALEDPDPVRTSMHCIDMCLERPVNAEHLCSLPHDAVIHLKHLKSGIAHDHSADVHLCHIHLCYGSYCGKDSLTHMHCIMEASPIPEGHPACESPRSTSIM